MRFTTNVHHTAHTNIAFDEISSDRKLQHLLTDVKISYESGVSSTVRIKLDAGACGNLLPFNIYKNIHPQVSIKDSCKTIDKRVCLEAYNKSEIKQLGTCCLTVGHGKSTKLCHFYIVPDYCRPILGFNDIHSLSLIAIKCNVTDKWSADSLMPMGSASIVNAVEEQSGSVLSKEQIVNGRFKKIFSGMGHFPIEPVDIVLSEDNVPVQKPAYRVPVAMKEKFRKELKSMAKAGIISKLDRNTPTPWLNSYVIVKKPHGSLRICLDPTNLNKYIVRPICNSRTLDDVSHQLKDAKFFSVFDATKEFFHLPLSAQSRLLTAMLTSEGVYVFNVLAMGLSNADNLFESALQDLLSGLPGVKNIADNILVFGSSQQEHDANVIRFLERCLEIDLHLNPDKVKINFSSVPFFGMVLTASGIKPDPKKVETIKKWPIL